MRLEQCIRRWLGLKAHRVVRVEETDDRLVAEIEAIPGRLPGPQRALVKGMRFFLLKNP